MTVSAKQLRARWIGQEPRIAAIVADLKAGEDWTRHIIFAPGGPEKPLAYLEQCGRPVLPNERARRDLRGIVLRDVDLTATTRLADTDLDYAVFENVHLEGASLTGSSLKGATLIGTTSLQHVTARHASFVNSSCQGISFMEADLFHANLCGCDLRHADLRGTVMAHVQWNSEGAFDLFSPRRRWSKFGGPYQTMDDLHRDTRMRLRKHIATSSAVMDLHHEHSLLAWIWYALADYGRSAGRLALATFVCWLFFAYMYVGRNFMISGESCPMGVSDAMYLSVVTLTTLGYGDIVPLASDSLARFLVGVEALSGIVIIGALISILIQNATISTD